MRKYAGENTKNVLIAYPIEISVGITALIVMQSIAQIERCIVCSGKFMSAHESLPKRNRRSHPLSDSAHRIENLAEFFRAVDRKMLIFSRTYQPSQE